MDREGRSEIRLSFEGHDGSTITFNQDTGKSGPQAFEKLRDVLNRVAPKG